MTKEVVSPSRRVLQSYHKTILNHPKQYGIVISKQTLLQGRAPTLLVTSNGTISKHGRILRKQLSENGQPIFSKEKITQPHSSIVLLHGRKGRKEDLLPIAERFCALGFRCILPDLPCHGESPILTSHYGTSDFETQLPHQVFSELANTQGFAQQPVHLWGMSMGGSFLTHSAASPKAPWKSLTIISSFGSLQQVVDLKVPHYLRSLVDRKIQSHGGTSPTKVLPIRQATKVNLPLLQIHGTEDKLIPISQGKEFFRAFSSQHKEFVEVPAADHDNILITPMKLYAKMATFMLTQSGS